MTEVGITWYGGDGRMLGAAMRQSVVVPLLIGPPGMGTQEEIDELLAMIAALTARIAALEAGGVTPTGPSLDFSNSNNSGLLALFMEDF